VSELWSEDVPKTPPHLAMAEHPLQIGRNRFFQSDMESRLVAMDAVREEAEAARAEPAGQGLKSS
jgi:hypothetical protein